MQVYPGDPEVGIEQVAAVATEGFWLHELTMGSQSGTHVDAPAHVQEAAGATDSVSAQRLVANAWIVDVTHVKASGLIGLDSLEAVLSLMSEADAVILRAGWDQFDGDEQAWAHPGISVDAARALVAAGVSFVGVDFASVDRHGESGLPAHQVFAGAGVPIVENLANLDQVTWHLPLVVVGMLPVVGIDGAPARVFAIELGAIPS